MKTDRDKTATKSPPSRSTGLLSDCLFFLLHKPEIPTLIKFETEEERRNYSLRIMQRLGISTDQYSILNIHKIGVDTPASYVFEELLKWDGDSTCWPNHLANVGRIDRQLDNIELFLFGRRRYPFGLKNGFLGLKFIPLFRLKALKFQLLPDTFDFDNARYLLFKSSGGYPIGIFSMYVRSSIDGLNEAGQAQLFFVVGFNFYGKENWPNIKIVNRLWEWVHDRATANILNRIKQLSEWRFEKIQRG
ncbi:MAG: hypothetical protein EPO28_04135 [Saprospiraceae bacterium]|nr:MAG: hypothetical protein EPO28_04135 [Saprospiraceae bacterium]